MKSYLRFLSRNKLYTAIEVVGLSISLAFVTLIGTYVWQQYGTIYNTDDHERIYCIGRTNNEGKKFHGLHPTGGEALKENIPEVEEVCQYYSQHESPFTFGGNTIMSASACIDKEFFKMFGCRFLAGSLDDFDNINNVIVTESFANAHGGIENIIGKTISKNSEQFIVAGVIEDLANSVISYHDIFLNFYKKGNVGMYIHDTYTFLKLREGVAIEDIDEKIEREVQNVFDMSPFPLGYKPLIMSFKEVFFDDEADFSKSLNNCDSKNLMIMTFVVILLLISAMINFINLSAAMSSKRVKETATRMVSGAESGSIFRRFIMESVALCLACMTFSILLALALESYMNSLLNSDIDINISMSVPAILLYATGAVIIGLLVGILPGFIGVSVKPLEVLKGQFRARNKMIFSKVFIVFQNVISIVLIALVMTMNRQLNHMLDRPIGADVEDLYYLWIDDYKTRGPLVEELEKLPFVVSIGLSEGYPGGTILSLMQMEEGQKQAMGIIYCDTKAFEMYDFKYIDKRSDDPASSLWATQITYDSYKAHGFDLSDPENLKRMSFSKFGGILSDFALTDPLNIENDMWCQVCVFPTEGFRSFMSNGAGILIKTIGNHKDNAIAITEVYRKFSENLKGVYVAPRDAGYIGALLESKLNNVKNQSKIMNIFMILSILLSFMGLVAMSTYYSDESIGDIAIRKVYGGTVEDETANSVWKYTMMVILSCVIAIPVAIFACSRYLDTFVYRTDNVWWVYVLTILAIVLVSVAAVFVQTLRAAGTNPAEALKKE